MKQPNKIVSAFISFFCATSITVAQSWTQEANFTPGPRLGASYFAIGAMGYVGFGNDGTVNDLWAYDPSSNAWTQMASLPVTGGRNETVCFTIGNTGYIGLGYIGNATETNQIWGYDPTSNSWSQAASYPGSWTRDAVAFAVDTSAYVVAGQASPVFYQYNQPGNTWIQKANIPTAMERGAAAAFSIGGKGYYGLGVLGATALDDIWEYDPATDTWTQKSNFSGNARVGVVAFSTTNKGYIGAGTNNAGAYYNDFWEYDPVGDTWTQKTNVGGNGRANGVGFAIGCSAYVGLGRDNADDLFQDFWQLSVCTASPLTDSISATNDVCNGGNTGAATANPSGGMPPYTYRWLPGGQTAQTITGLSAGVYKVTITDSAHATIADSVIITQPLQPFVLTVSADTTVCSGQPVALTSSASGGAPGYIYKWLPVAGLSDSTGSMVTANPTNTITYYVIATDTNLCHSLPQNVTITINSLPVPVVTAADTIICSSDSTQVCTGDTFATYLWNTGGTSFCTTAGAAGGYWVTVTDANHCSAISNHRQISVYPVPSVSIDVTGDTLSSYGALSYQWLLNGALLGGDTSPVYVAQNTGYYSVEITDSNGCTSVSNSSYVTITGITSVFNTSLQVSPNPFDNIIRIKINNPATGALAITIYNIIGQAMITSQISVQAATDIWMDASALPAGTYYLRIGFGNDYQVKKLFKE